MKRILNSDSTMCMPNIPGRRVVVPSCLPFSFYFSQKNSDYEIRVKPLFNAEHMSISDAGTLKLCDDWEYTPGPDDHDVSERAVRRMKQFFRDYLVLFCMVWDGQLYEDILQDYFTGQCELHELIQNVSFYSEHEEDLNNITSVYQLEDFCVDNNLVNIRDN